MTDIAGMRLARTKQSFDLNYIPTFLYQLFLHLGGYLFSEI